MKRLNPEKSTNRSQQAIKLQVKYQFFRNDPRYLKAKREMERDQQLNRDNSSSGAPKRGPQLHEAEASPILAVNGVLFTCELLGDEVILPKNEVFHSTFISILSNLFQMTNAVEEFLLEQMSDDPVVASALMIHSLNSPEKVRLAVETLSKYVANLVSDPGVEKYRRIRVSNKAFQVLNYYNFQLWHTLYRSFH
jgi:hypothetical protein